MNSMNRCFQLPSRGHQSRSGAVLIAVLACMMITIVLVGGAMKSTMAARRQCKSELQMQQAELLLQAGVARIAPEIVSGTASVVPPKWDAREALAAYPVAHVEYHLVEASESGPQGIRCMARLAISNQPQDVITLSRVIAFRKPSAENPNKSSSENR